VNLVYLFLQVIIPMNQTPAELFTGSGGGGAGGGGAGGGTKPGRMGI